MAVIENAAASPEALAEWRASMRGMDRAELVAQQLVQRGAEHAIAALQRLGPTTENCAAMLASIREALIEVHAAANERGIPLLDYAAPTSHPNAAAQEQQATTPKAFDAFLCRAWGETDLPSAELVTDWEGVRRFMVREWLGSEDETDYDGTVTLDRLKADFDEHEEDQRGGAYEVEFEIGGVSIERVCGFAAPGAAIAAREQGADDEVLVACITLHGATLTVEPHQMAEMFGADDEQHTYELSFKRMTRATFEALGEFNGF